MKYRYLDVFIEDQIVHVLLNNPANQNEMNAEMAKDLLSLARDLQELEDIKVVVLGARGHHFSIGLNPHGDKEVPDDESYSAVTLASAAIEEWARLPYPIISAIKGKCLSLGLSLACIADMRFGAENSVYSVPESRWGFVPAGGITQRLPRLIGKGPAMSMLLGGELIKSSHALKLGLINYQTDIELVWEKACQKAKELAKMSTLSMKYTKECVLRGSELPFNQALRLEIDVYMLLQTSEDRMEGVQAYLEKREPLFKGE